MEGIWLEIGQEAVMTIAGIILAALGAMGAFYIKKLIAWLNEKQVLETVSRYVRWAEQAPAFQDFSGEDKFEIVFSKAIQYLKDHNVPIAEDELGIMIEDAVKKMKEAAEPLYIGTLE